MYATLRESGADKSISTFFAKNDGELSGKPFAEKQKTGSIAFNSSRRGGKSRSSASVEPRKSTECVCLYHSGFFQYKEKYIIMTGHGKMIGIQEKTKKLIRLCVAALLLCALPLCAAAAASELLNPEWKLAENGIPENWDVNSYNRSGYSVSVEDGQLVLSSTEENDLRLCQTVTLQPNAVYVLSAEVRTEDVSGGCGAVLSVDNYSLDGCNIYGETVTGTTDWKKLTLVFRTNKDQKEINIALRLGGYGETSSGIARFRNITLERGTGEETDIVSMKQVQAKSDQSETQNYILRSVPHLLMVSSVLIAIILLFGFYRNRRELGSYPLKDEREKFLILLTVLAGLLLRVALYAKWRGHDVDMNCWIGWGQLVAENGPARFYTDAGHEWYDYPPGYMLVLGGIYRLITALRLSTDSVMGGFAFVLPAYIADVLIALLLRREAKKRGFSAMRRFLLVACVIFSPPIVVLSGAWGQTDSILTLFLLCSLLLLLDKKPIAAGAVYGFAIVTKWQALIFGPVLAALYLFRLRTKKDVLKTVAAVAAALGVIFIVSLPFRGTQEPLWLVRKFLSSSGGYPYASIEAFNFMALFNGNWAPENDSILFGISYKQFGTAMIVLSVLLSVYTLGRACLPTRNKDTDPPYDRGLPFLCAAFCMFMIYTFGNGMHERYAFPVLLLLLFAYAETEKPQLLFASLLLSAVVFLNEAEAQFALSKLAESVVRGGKEYNAVLRAGSVAEVTTFFWFAAACCRKTKDKGREEK